MSRSRGEYGSGDLASSCGDLARDTLSRLQSMGTRDAVRAWSDVETDPGVGACALWRRCVDHAVGGQGLARGSRASRCSHASGALVVVPATAAVTTTTTDNHDQGGRRSHAPHGTIASTRTHGTNIASMCEATAPEAVGVQQHHALAQNPHHIRVPTVQAHDREVAGRLLPRLPWPRERVSASAFRIEQFIMGSSQNKMQYHVHARALAYCACAIAIVLTEMF